jgi:predicted RNA-binding protein YlqC (UPF0109 family)
VSRELIEYLGGWLLDHPEDLTVDELEGDRDQTIFEISVHPEDMGKIIGKRGRIIHAIRSLSRVAAQGEGGQVLVEVVD